MPVAAFSPHFHLPVTFLTQALGRVLLAVIEVADGLFAVEGHSDGRFLVARGGVHRGVDPGDVLNSFLETHGEVGDFFRTCEKWMGDMMDG